MNIKEAISTLVTKVDLSESEMIDVMNEIMEGEATPAQIGSFLTALRMKSETIAEITGAVRVMRKKATFIASGVVAGAGVAVAKHGNRSVSSNCGSADVLEAVGVRLDIDPLQIGQCIQEIGIGFLFAPALHGAMKYAIGPRKEMGIRTLFNILGPLTNPAGANVQVLGVFSKELTEPMAHVLAQLGSKRALVVHGEGNLDELTVTGETRISELRDGKVNTYSIQPEEFGFTRASIDQLQGGDTVEESAAQMRAILGGETGAKRDMILLNSGAALMAAGTVPDLKAGIIQAAEVIDSGAAANKLDQLIAMTNSFS